MCVFWYSQKFRLILYQRNVIIQWAVQVKWEIKLVGFVLIIGAGLLAPPSPALITCTPHIPHHFYTPSYPCKAWNGGGGGHQLACSTMCVMKVGLLETCTAGTSFNFTMLGKTTLMNEL